jgi:hypothetical protein
MQKVWSLRVFLSWLYITGQTIAPATVVVLSSVLMEIIDMCVTDCDGCRRSDHSGLALVSYLLLDTPLYVRISLLWSLCSGWASMSVSILDWADFSGLIIVCLSRRAHYWTLCTYVRALGWAQCHSAHGYVLVFVSFLLLDNASYVCAREDWAERYWACVFVIVRAD